MSNLSRSPWSLMSVQARAAGLLWLHLRDPQLD
jgi:hypothetical protein